jgi:hypothetical protein
MGLDPSVGGFISTASSISGLEGPSIGFQGSAIVTTGAAVNPFDVDGGAFVFAGGSASVGVVNPHI